MGPRQMTGLVSSSMSRLSDIISMPSRVVTGRMNLPPSMPMALSCTPNARGMEGPVMSASSTATLLPSRKASTASSEVTSDFPTPPFPLTTPMTRLTSLSSFCATRKSAFAHLDEQLPQSCEQPSLICTSVNQVILSSSAAPKSSVCTTRPRSRRLPPPPRRRTPRPRNKNQKRARRHAFVCSQLLERRQTETFPSEHSTTVSNGQLLFHDELLSTAFHSAIVPSKVTEVRESQL